MSERALDENERTKWSVLMVSFAVKSDDPAARNALANKRQVDTTRWAPTGTDAANAR